MATMLVHHKVKDYAAWKAVYDSAADLRVLPTVNSRTLYTRMQTTRTA